ncbi:MAG: LysR substrate-binding domain-containing protein [Arenicellales bacterium WSBS_2016_MAG_OTU3]
MTWFSRPRFSTTSQAFDRALTAAGVSVNPVIEINKREASREAVLRGFAWVLFQKPTLAPSPNIRALQVSNVDLFTNAYLVCLAERRDRPLIDAYFRTAASIDPKRRGAM